MEVGVRELRNETARIIDAVRSGERVTLSVRGEAIADIVPHGGRSRWLAGPAMAGLPVVTQDTDYDRMASAHEPLQVLKV